MKGDRNGRKSKEEIASLRDDPDRNVRRAAREALKDAQKA
jgi:oligoendopeptidase F